MVKIQGKKKAKKARKSKKKSVNTIQLHAGQTMVIRFEVLDDLHTIHIDHITVISANQVNFDGNYAGVDETTLVAKLYRLATGALISTIDPMTPDNPNADHFSESWANLNLATGSYAIVVTATSTGAGHPTVSHTANFNIS